MKQAWPVWMVVPMLFVSKPAISHDWYEELQVPGTMQKCCGKKDCAAYPHRMNDSETVLELLIRGKWHQVPEDVILRDHVSPDGQVHACCWNGATKPAGCEAKDPVVFRCVVPLGQGV